MAAPETERAREALEALAQDMGQMLYERLRREGLSAQTAASVSSDVSRDIRARAALGATEQEPEPVEIRPDEAGEVDEIVMKRGAFHLERLQENTWWVGLYPEGMRDRVTFVFTGKKTKVTVTEEFAAVPVAPSEEKNG